MFAIFRLPFYLWYRKKIGGKSRRIFELCCVLLFLFSFPFSLHLQSQALISTFELLINKTKHVDCKCGCWGKSYRLDWRLHEWRISQLEKVYWDINKYDGQTYSQIRYVIQCNTHPLYLQLDSVNREKKKKIGGII